MNDDAELYKSEASWMEGSALGLPAEKRDRSMGVMPAERISCARKYFSSSISPWTSFLESEWLAGLGFVNGDPLGRPCTCLCKSYTS